MPPLDEDRRAVAEETWRRLAIINELTPRQARLFVRSLQTSWRVPVINWTNEESAEQFGDALRLVHAAGIYAVLEGATAALRAVDCYRRAGEILEWLSRSDDPLQTAAPISLYAAAAFQLGDMPAMATALLGRPRVRYGGEKLYADFFRGDLDGVLDTTAAFWSEHLQLAARHRRRSVRVFYRPVLRFALAARAVSDRLRKGGPSAAAKSALARMSSARASCTTASKPILRSPRSTMLMYVT